MSTKNRYFKELKPWYVPYLCKSNTTNNKRRQKDSPRSNLADEDDVLIFESRFESGNLRKAI
jgi:hypothetical protein